METKITETQLHVCDDCYKHHGRDAIKRPLHRKFCEMCTVELEHIPYNMFTVILWNVLFRFFFWVDCFDFFYSDLLLLTFTSVSEANTGNMLTDRYLVLSTTRTQCSDATWPLWCLKSAATRCFIDWWPVDSSHKGSIVLTLSYCTTSSFVRIVLRMYCKSHAIGETIWSETGSHVDNHGSIWFIYNCSYHMLKDK